VRGICVYDGGDFPGAPVGRPLRREAVGDTMQSVVPFTTLLDLASERLGGSVLFATDDFFAPKENLLKPGPAVFVPGRYTDRGKWMDGWESRRKREPGHDWCVIRLGVPGAIHGVNLDTAHFLGNFPPFAWIEAAACTDEAAQSDAVRWTEILPRVNLRGGVENLFPIANRDRWTHLRLHIQPDGGVARCRVHGVVLPDWNALHGNRIDLVAAVHGGTVVTCNDMFFGPKENLIMPGRAANMSDGWETRRRRTPGNDWIVLRLGHAGRIHRIEIDTAWFKGNFPESASIEGTRLGDASPLDVAGRLRDDLAWEAILPRTKLQADHVHTFESAPDRVVDHVRLNIYPDGGVSRLRLLGEMA
jgi:allantoicase